MSGSQEDRSFPELQRRIAQARGPALDPVAQDEWDKRFVVGSVPFWRLVQSNAWYEADRIDYRMEQERAERYRSEQDRLRRASLVPFAPRPNAFSIGEALAKLERVRRAGDGKWRARCPVHGGTDPLLVVEKDTSPGEAYFYCFRGCDFREIIAALKELA